MCYKFPIKYTTLIHKEIWIVKQKKPMKNSSIGQRVIECRKEKGMTQAELIKASGLSGQTIVNLEKNYYAPNISTILKISEIFGVTLDWLIIGKGPKLRKC